MLFKQLQKLHNKIVLIAILLGLLFSAPMSILAQSQDQAVKDIQRRFPILMETYGAKLQNLDIEYIVAIDLSGSMNKTAANGIAYIEDVKRGLIQFLQAIPDKSRISIVGFGATVRWIQIPTTVNQQSRQEIAGVINSIKSNEGYTDLKGAVHFLIEGCQSSSAIKYLFMFTDFNNDPTTSSSFNATSWDALQQKYALASKNYLIEAFALKLPISNDAGRDLPSVRMVFPGLNVIDFNSVSLQSWFNNRSGKMLEQNLWTFVSKDFERIRSKKLLHLKATMGLEGNLYVKAKPDSLPKFVTGVMLEDMSLKDLVVQGNDNKLSFTPTKLLFGKSAKIGKIINDGKQKPFAKLMRFQGTVQGNLITSCEKELEQLYATVMASNKVSEVKTNTEDLYSFYAEKIAVANQPYATWNVWVLLGLLISILTILFFSIKNSLLPQRLKGYGVRINGGDLIKLGKRYKYKVSSEKGDLKLDIPNKLEFDIYCSKSTPFNLLIKKSVAIRIIKGKPSVRVSNSPVPKSNTYKLPLLKEIIVSEGVSNITLQFYKV